MNRWDEIKAAALDAAGNVTDDPEIREQFAADLIRLCGLMVEAVGKGVAVEGESSLNDAEDAEDQIKAHGMYLTGERIQDAAKTAAQEALGADLKRYERGPYGRVVWSPTRRPAVPSAAAPDNARCNECNRVLRFGHMIGCSQRGDAYCAAGVHVWTLSMNDEGQPDVGLGGEPLTVCRLCGTHRAAPARDLRCTATSTDGRRCSKPAYHRPAGSDDPHAFRESCGRENGPCSLSNDLVCEFHG